MRRRSFLLRLGALTTGACAGRDRPLEPPPASPTTAVSPSPATVAASPSVTPFAQASPTTAPVIFSPYQGELFDAHAHYVPEIITALRPTGISGNVVFAGGNVAQVLQLASDRPEVLPYLGFPRDARTGALQWNSDGLAYLSRTLASGRWRGVGEVIVHHRPLNIHLQADGSVALQLFQLAADRRVPVNVHCDGDYIDELDRALARNPNTLVIWAHVGAIAAPGDVHRLLLRHPRLYADISSRWEPFTPRIHIEDAAGRLLPEWRTLLEDLSERFLFGSDIGPAQQPGQPILGPDASSVGRVVGHYRGLLAQLGSTAAERIAIGNARRLFSGSPDSLVDVTGGVAAA